MMTIVFIKNRIKEARKKGWWIACFYWERKLEEVEKKCNLVPTGE
jgi:hypothetical protein